MADSTMGPVSSEPAGDPAPESPSAARPGRDDALRARDRVLLYTRGMDAAPQAGLEFALDSLRRSGPHAEPLAAMRELHNLLREHGLSLHLTDADGHLLNSAPPMNRRPMIAEAMENPPLVTSLHAWLRRLAGLPARGRGQ